MWRCTFIYSYTYIHTPHVNLRYGRNYWIYDSFACLKYLQKQHRGNQVSDTVKCFMFGECQDVTINGASGAGTEKAMAPHSSTLAWKIPRMEEPGGLQSMGSLRVGHDWGTSLSLFTFTHWRRKWQPTPVFLPGESQGRGSLVGCLLWGHTESNTTEAT